MPVQGPCIDGDDLVDIRGRRVPLSEVDLNEAPQWGWSLASQTIGLALRLPLGGCSSCARHGEIAV